MSSASRPRVEFYIIRHGESTGNRQGILQGQMDYPLTDIGRQQAVAAGKRLAGISFDVAFSSDLSRARETAELIVSQLGQEEKPRLRLEQDLRELKGGAREGRPLSVNMTEAIELAAAEAGVSVEEFDPPYFETAPDLARRANAFITKALGQITEEFGHLAAEERPVKVLIVSHGGLLLQMFTKVFKAKDLNRVLNASLTHVEALIHEELSPPSFAFKAVNCVDHLVELDIVTVRSTAL